MSQRLDLKSHSCLTSSFFYPAPSTPFLVPPRGTSLINHLFLNAQLGVCFWGSPPEEHNQISWWVLVFTEYVWNSKPLRYPCWEPWPCAQKSRGCRTNRGPACDLHHSRLWPWSSNEHHTNRHDFSSDRLFLLLFNLPHTSFDLYHGILSRKLKLCYIHDIPALLHEIFQNKDWNRNFSEFCNTEVYSRPTFIGSAGRRWGSNESRGMEKRGVHI